MTTYTWYIATAGGTKSSGNEEFSICPKNWKLPSSLDGDFQQLYNAYPSASLFLSSPLSFATGRYWSSTLVNKADAYTLNLSSSTVDPVYNFGTGKQYLYNVRCIAR